MKTHPLLKIFLGIILAILIQGTFAAVKVIVEPEQGITPILQAIQHAKKSIKMEMYLLSDKKIIRALIKSAKRGVNVQVLLEQKPYQSSSHQKSQLSKVFSQLSNASVNVKWSNPHYQLTHEKAMIIDHKTAYILTFNQTYSAYKFNREYGIIDSDKKDVNEIENVFNQDWLYKSPKLFNKNLLWSPINARTKMMKLIHSAKHYLYIEAEEINDWAIESALAHKAKAGIDVRIIMPQQKMLAKNQMRLLKNGVKIRFLNQTKSQLYVHAKMILADGQTAYLGSENLSFASLNYNRELGIILYASRGYQEKHILKILEKTFLIDWKDARK